MLLFTACSALECTNTIVYYFLFSFRHPELRLAIAALFKCRQLTKNDLKINGATTGVISRVPAKSAL